jgi:hypothetical protein
VELKMRLAGESVALRARDGYADAGVTSSGDMAALELEILGELRVSERDDGRLQVLSLDFTGGREHMRRIGLLLLSKSGAPAFTNEEWLEIADALEGKVPDGFSDDLIRHRERMNGHAAKIREAYLEDIAQ